jgi:hypothetical protein
MQRKLYILFLILAATAILAAGKAYAQSVPIPNPNWPLDSVINGNSRQYTINGDPNYASPSTFVWTVEGGHIYTDAALSLPLGNGYTGQIEGTADNKSTVWVVWDDFLQPLDTGYVYVYEISADECEMPDTDENKYVGRRVKVSAPPDVRFLEPETFVCSYADPVVVDIVIEGMPPFDLTYSINGEFFTEYILPEDMVDSDGDGEVNNYTITIDEFQGTIYDVVYILRLEEASSGGVQGNILQYPTHTITAYRQPDAPIIFDDRTQVTRDSRHTYFLEYAGENPEIWIWEMYDEWGNLVFESQSGSRSEVSIDFNYADGIYDLHAFYIAENQCESYHDTLQIEVFGQPQIAFSETTGDVTTCSESSIIPTEYFEFLVEYQGALSYSFLYEVFDYEGNSLGTTQTEWQTSTEAMISIPNTFINDAVPEINRVWTIKIINAINEEGYDVEVIDSDIEGGNDERRMIIHPKPFVDGEIDFYN